MTGSEQNDSSTGSMFPINRSVGGKGLDTDSQIEAVRKSILDEIEIAKSIINQQIDLLRSTQQDFEMEDVISQLENQLRHLSSQALAASTGSIAALMALSRTMPNMVANNARVSALAHTEAAYQSAIIVFEMTEDQVSYYHAQHDRQAIAFASYEQRSSGHIEQLAAANGVDIAAYRDNRQQLLKEKEEAKAKGDRLGTFRADVLLSVNNTHGLVKSGAADQEIERSQQESAKARERYLREVEFQARKSAISAGMSEQQTIEHIANARISASNDLAEEERKLAQSNGVDPQRSTSGLPSSELVERAKETNAASSVEEFKNMNNRTSETVIEGEQSIKSARDRGNNQKLSDRKSADSTFAGLGVDIVNEKPASGAVTVKKLAVADVDHNQVERPNTPAISDKTDGKSIV